MKPKRLFAIAAVLAAVGVMLGAFGAHALRDRVTPERLEVWRTAVLYHMLHALGLMAIAAARRAWPAIAAWPAHTMLAGIAVFSGSLYLLVLTDTGWLGAVTPIGGLLLIASWLGLGVSAWRVRE